MGGNSGHESKWRVEEWDFGLIVKILTKERAKERWIITVYNNVGGKKIVENVRENGLNYIKW